MKIDWRQVRSFVCGATVSASALVIAFDLKTIWAQWFWWFLLGVALLSFIGAATGPARHLRKD